jgi:putative transposase
LENSQPLANRKSVVPARVNTWTIGALKVQADHVQLFFSASPNISPERDGLTRSQVIARRVFQPFPEVKKNHFWCVVFWSRSYYVGSGGDMSVHTVLKYIEAGQDF